MCAACKRPLTQSYYTANRAIICDQCHGQFRAYLAGGSRFKRAFAATALGLLAGLAGAALWYAVRKITGYEIGLIAIAVGLMVGVAVRKGSKGRGGWFYQTLAIVLTYCCICAQYMPDIVEGLMQKFREHHAAPAGPAKNPAAGNAHDKAPAKNAPAEKPAPDDAAAPKPGVVKMTLAVACFLVIAFIISLALPFLAGVQKPHRPVDHRDCPVRGMEDQQGIGHPHRRTISTRPADCIRGAGRMSSGAAILTCQSCGAEISPGLLACPGCHRLVHAARLSTLAEEACCRSAGRGHQPGARLLAGRGRTVAAGDKPVCGRPIAN